MGRDSQPSIVSAEARKKPAKVLDHLELHPKMGGGHIVKHIYTSYEHNTHEVHFNEKGTTKGGEHITAHLAKHAGLPAYKEASATEAESDV
jgi:hypothetical protein